MPTSKPQENIELVRLHHPTIRPTGRAITFLFDDKPIQALEGETVAAALSGGRSLRQNDDQLYRSRIIPRHGHEAERYLGAQGP